jgi:hypothetical protein
VFYENEKTFSQATLSSGSNIPMVTMYPPEIQGLSEPWFPIL